MGSRRQFKGFRFIIIPLILMLALAVACKWDAGPAGATGISWNGRAGGSNTNAGATHANLCATHTNCNSSTNAQL
jgi:hypothetical protein